MTPIIISPLNKSSRETYMETAFNFGVWSLVPLIFALITVFWTRSAIFSLFSASLIGVILMGYNPDATMWRLDPAGELVKLQLALTVNSSVFE